MRISHPGRVSVVVINYEAAAETLECLESVFALEWPADRLEVVVVDNASRDGSGAEIKAAFPGVRLIELTENEGFAGGCNRAVEQSSGEYIALLNNDARAHAEWLRRAVAALERDSSLACVACKVLDWSGDRIDFVDAGMTFYGHGFPIDYGKPASPLEDVPTDVLFASGAGAVMRTSAFRHVGGFDERYFMFFEDVDLGWRFWLLGYRVRYEPGSIVYHRHHQTVGRHSDARRHYLLERNALFTIYKNYDDDNLQRALPAALLLAIRRGIALGGDDPHAMDIAEHRDPVVSEHLTVHEHTLATTFAVDAFVENLPGLVASRRELQAGRRRADHEILPLFRRPMQKNIDHPSFAAGYDAVLGAFNLSGFANGRRRILVATGDVLKPKMAGPAIRAWQIAKLLSREHDVQLVSDQPCGLSHPDFVVAQVGKKEMARLERWADVIIFQGNLMRQFGALRRSRKILVADVYDPYHLEVLEQSRFAGHADRRFAVRSSTEVINEQLMRGDFILCASEKQRDFWLGQLAAVGRVNELTYDTNERLESLIAVVPFGIDDEPPRATKTVLRGVVPGIEADDQIILWGGGIYNWFDPLTLLRAVDKLRRRIPSVRLFFMGLKHPNPVVGEMHMAVQTRELAEELGLTGTHVFFNEDWVEYDERHNYLLEADIGVSTHLDHIETAFSFRTRVLDYIWASLPVVSTNGDSLAELIDRSGVGLTVPPGDVDALEDALFLLLDDEEFRLECRRRTEEVARSYAWANVLRPLADFCRDPKHARDLLDPELAATARDPLDLATWRPKTFRRDLDRVLVHLRRGEVGPLVTKLLTRLRRRVTKLW